jgi:hypothetical protein
MVFQPEGDAMIGGATAVLQSRKARIVLHVPHNMGAENCMPVEGTTLVSMVLYANALRLVALHLSPA